MTKIDPTQPSQPADKPSKPAKAQPQQPIIIDFSVLPDKLKTQEVRAKFDKDGSGFLESNGKKGNEYLAMAEFAKSMGVDLSKYKLDGAIRVDVDPDSYVDPDVIDVIPATRSKALDSKGKTIVELTSHGNKKDMLEGYYRVKYDGNSATEQVYDENAKPVDSAKTETIEKNVTFNGQKGLTKTTTTYSDEPNYQHITYERGGAASRETNEVSTKDYYEYHIDKEGSKVRFTSENRALKGTTEDKYGIALQDNFYTKSLNETEMFDYPNSKNKLVKTETTEYKRPNIGEKRRATEEEREANTKKSTNYTLNGKPVQVRRSKNARFEVTTDKNETKYYSHDGKNLRIDYATGDEKILPDGRKIVSSLDGKTNWYFDRDGKSVSVAEFYDWKHTPFAIKKNGNKTTYTYCGKQVKAVPIENGRYKVTLPDGKTVTCSHDGKLLKESHLRKK